MPLLLSMNRASNDAKRSGCVRNPVLLIHGLIDTIAVFHGMSAYLNALGWLV